MKKNILIIAYAHDYPTKKNIFAGQFIKEFVDSLSNTFNCYVMLIEKKFIFTNIRSQIRMFMNLIMTLFRRINFRAEGDPTSNKDNVKEDMRIIHVAYPVFVAFNKQINIFDGLSACFTAQRALSRSGFRPDIIQAFKAFPSAYIGWKFKLKFNIPVVNTEYQGPFSSYANTKCHMKQALNAIRNIDKTVYTKFQIGVIRRYGIPEDRLGYGHFGVDTEKFTIDSSKYLQPKIVLEKGKIKLLVIGRIEEEKGLKYLIKAMYILVKHYPDIELSIVGSKGNCFDWVIDEIDSLGIRKNIHFLGFVPYNDLPTVINNHDIVVVASLYETFGLTVIESLSCGKPVVATKCGGPEEVINNDVGVLVPVKDEVALADGVKYVVANYDRYDPHKLREYVLNNYSYEVVSKKFISLYNELLDEYGNKVCVA